MSRYCFALDLVDDPTLISEYEMYHQSVWPEVKQSIVESGIDVMDIYRVGNRLFMIMEVQEGFSFDNKAAADASKPIVQEWEQLTWKYQQALPFARPGEKWILMQRIFSLGG